MRLSIIIPAVNEAANIERAVHSAWLAGADEVLVSDGGSTDGTEAICRGLNCCWVLAPRGRGPQLNAAAQKASGDFLLFLHADNWFTGPVRSQIEQARASGARTVAFVQQIDALGWKYRLLEAGNAWRVKWLGLPYGDQALGITRELFEKLGGFPQFPIMEDVALMRRSRSFGWPVLLAGPLMVSARRWRDRGVLRQTARNWLLLGAWLCGVSPFRLSAFYPRHDQKSE